MQNQQQLRTKELDPQHRAGKPEDFTLVCARAGEDADLP